MVSEQIEALGSDQQILFVERVVVWLPVDLGHVEVRWDSFLYGQVFEL